MDSGPGFGQAPCEDDPVKETAWWWPVALADDHSTVLAWQAGAGLALPLTARWTVTVDYRYFATEDPEIDLAGRGGRFTSAYASHNVVGGLRFEF